MSIFLEAALTALAGIQRVHKMNAVPANPTPPYLEVSVRRAIPVGYTLDARHGVERWWVITRAFAKTAEGAQDYDDQAADALLDERLAAAGYDCGPCELLTATSDRDPDDDGWIGITTTYQFTATKETP